ncbi:MAG TPA: nucleotide exchange factor GrpE [Steroidobacteraceae bacterium]|nr:nucleotide exchange factor GrpE [Steroidobacteraceae bacterium]
MSGTETEQPGPVPENGQSPDGLTTESQLAAAEGRAEQHRADFLRAIAELENFRKRSAREVDAARQFGIERFAADLLTVVDTLGIAVESAPGADAATLAQGQEATLRLLLKAFERAGLAVVDPVGQAFDPALHEAMAMQPSAAHPVHTVLQVVQKGWLLNGRLLRPARVIVSTAPETQDRAESGG